MGFMDAVAAQREAEEEAAEVAGEEEEKRTKARSKKPKGTTTKRQSPLAVGRAVSLRPYRGELSFNAVSGEKKKGALSLYNAEMHTTEYQYSFGVNLNDVVNKSHIGALIDALVDPPQVAGNHSRFAYDFSPASIVLRVTHAHSSRIQNCFEHDESTRGVNLQRLVQRVGSGDVPAAEVIIGGEIASSPDGKRLGELGATLFQGVLAAATEARRRIAELDASLAAVGR
jgi:CRISPR-associated protein Cst2